VSRAERRVVPPPPRLGRVVREAIGDFAYNSWRFLGANLLVGTVLVIVALLTVETPLALALTLAAVPPAAGLMRMATRLVRDGHADFGDVTEVLRAPWRALGVGAAQLLLTLVLLADVRIGAGIDAWVGTFVMVSALYGLLVGWVYAAVLWPILLDPERDADPLRARLRLALVVLVAHPLRLGGVLLLFGALLLLSALVIAPLLTFSVALVWLAIARYVLPVADRIEGRATRIVEDDEAGGA
jgi:uncharacterized membrane protein YesL